MPSTLHSVEQKYLDRKTSYTMRLGQKAQLDKQIENAREQRADVLKRIELYSKTQELLLKASETARQLAQEKIEHVVTLALTAITGEPYEFKMELNKHAGNWNVTFRVINPAGANLDPIDSCGGGIADICSMALRIAILELFEPRVDGPLELDENFKFLSRDHVRTAVEFMHTLVEKTGRQIILVTHVPELAAGADRVFEVVPKGDTSEIINITVIDELDSLE